MESVIGQQVSEAKQRLESLGFVVRIVEYESRRGIENADSTRVLRQNDIGNNTIELVVSHFKTHMNDD
ncbi:MAG: PASTA domain-containing protein [Clostridia bacterium]|jgi:hypothetical protein|nr:PASTA domain-containing protein [Clostridia bacterium]MBT7123162.1 PASTA domain-containing protein [Clostridia bacterium]